MLWKTRRHTLDLSHRAVVMGILNATPDSFSDGGLHAAGPTALNFALNMIDEGAEIIDIGGESTRPGAAMITGDEEISRVIPLIEHLRSQSDVLISVDTSKASVAEAALKAGADIINDVTGLAGPESGQAMAEVCRASGAGVVVMHMQGNPETMQQGPDYQDDGGVVDAVSSYFNERLSTLTEFGIDLNCLCFDPGIGFGKTLEHNLSLLRNLGRMQRCVGRPLLLGVSRKSTIGRVTGEANPENRDVGTAVLTAMTCRQGILLHRVHDVKSNVEAIQLAEAMGR